MRLPIPHKLGLGVGLDLPWGHAAGFVHDEGRDRLAPKVERFLAHYGPRFSYWFVSWQPRNRNRLDVADYDPVFDELLARPGAPPIRALHHTLLNCGALEAYDRRPILDFTNALCARHGFAWVNEDLGLWSLHGKPLPYPLAPYLTEDGLAACIRNVAEVQAGLSVPFVVEFPGFTDGMNFHLGTMDAYDYFRQVVEETDSPCNLDVGHLLSWRWLQGHRGEALFEDLDRLPLAHCFEVHLSGCQVVGGRFLDSHHGILLPEQLTLLGHLLARCPNLRAVTFEDPRLTDDGALIPRGVAGFEALAAAVKAWA